MASAHVSNESQVLPEGSCRPWCERGSLPCEGAGSVKACPDVVKGGIWCPGGINALKPVVEQGGDALLQAPGVEVVADGII